MKQRDAARKSNPDLGNDPAHIIRWTGDFVGTIVETCQENGWLFLLDPIEPWVDIRFASILYHCDPLSLKKNYLPRIRRIVTRAGIAIRLSELNALRAKEPDATSGPNGNSGRS